MYPVHERVWGIHAMISRDQVHGQDPVYAPYLYCLLTCMSRGAPIRRPDASCQMGRMDSLVSLASSQGASRLTTRPLGNGTRLSHLVRLPPITC